MAVPIPQTFWHGHNLSTVPIAGIDQGQMTYDGQHWHATEDCFCCARCKKSLLGRPFLPKQGQIFCSRACSVNEDTNGSDSSDSAFQSGRTREGRHSSSKSSKSSSNSNSGGKGSSGRYSADVDPLSLQMDLLSLSSQAPSLTREPPSWKKQADRYGYEGRNESSPSPLQLLSQCNIRTSYTQQDIRPKESAQSKRPPASALKGHSFNENWLQPETDDHHSSGLKAQASFNELPSSGFMDKRSISMHAFQREREREREREVAAQLGRSRNPISALRFSEQLTPLEQTPHGSMESLALSNATGSSCSIVEAWRFSIMHDICVSSLFFLRVFFLPLLVPNLGTSADGGGKRQEHLSRFSMPDLSKDSGMNVSEKSNMGTLNSSVQFHSSESLHSLTTGQPYLEMEPPVQVKYPLPYSQQSPGITILPPGFTYQEEDRVSLISSAHNARLAPMSERTHRRVLEPEEPPRRRHHHRSRRSRRSRSENALNLAAQHRPAMPERSQIRVCEDYDRFPPPRGPRDPINGGIRDFRLRQQPFRPCPRTTSDLTLQNPAPQRHMGRYAWDQYDYDDDWCSTCSSSSESEDEGYFLGEPIPKPVHLRYMTSEELLHKYSSTGLVGSGHLGTRGQLHTRKRRKSKNCIIS